MDGALDEAGERHGGGEHEDHAVAEEGSATADDVATSDVDPGVTLDVIDESPADGAEAAADAIDLGSLAEAIAALDERSDDADDRGLGHDEEDDSPFDAFANDDAGAGTGEDLASFIDEEALPPLDAERDERGGRGERGAGGAGEPAGAGAGAAANGERWERGRWEVVSGAGVNVPCWLVAASGAHVIGAGPTVMVLREGVRAAPEAPRVAPGSGADLDAIAVAAADGALFAAGRRGAIAVTTDGGASWASVAGPWAPAAVAPTLAATPGRLWAACAGALWSVRLGEGDRPETPVEIRKDGVLAIAAAGATLVVLTEQDGALAVERLRGDDEEPAREEVPAELIALLEVALGAQGASAAARGASPAEASVGRGSSAPPAMAASPILVAATASGKAVAIVGGGVVLVSRDGGKTYRTHRVAQAMAAAFAGGSADAALLVVAPHRPPRGAVDGLELHEIGAGATLLVAELAAAAAASVPRAGLAWDAERERMWLAGGCGLVGLERVARH